MPVLVMFQYFSFLLHIICLPIVNCDSNETTIASVAMSESEPTLLMTEEEEREEEGIPLWGKLTLTFILVIACGFIIIGVWKYLLAKGKKKKRKKGSHNKSPPKLHSQSESAEVEMRYFGDAEMKEVHLGKLADEYGSIKVKKPSHSDAKAILSSDSLASSGGGTVQFGSEVNLQQISQYDQARTRGQPIPKDEGAPASP